MTKEDIQNIINPKTNRLQLSKLTVSLEEAYCIYNDIKEKPLCKCNKKLKFINFKKGYCRSCGSSKCKNKRPTIYKKELDEEIFNELFKGKGFNYKLGQKYCITQKDCYDFKYPGREKCKCKVNKEFINFKIGYRKRCKCKEEIILTKKFLEENNAIIDHKLNSSFIKKYDVSFNEIYSVYHDVSIPKCICGKDCKILTFNSKPLYYCGNKKCKNSLLTREWIQNPENINKEFWIKNFSEENFINIHKVHKYHNLSYTGIYLKIKEFNLKIKKINKVEQELMHIISNAVQNTRQIIKPLELDIYSEEYKFGIEYNGLMWHSIGESKHSMFNNLKDEDILKYRHLNKTNLCKEKNIQLFHIFENEWIDKKKKDIWTSIIKEKMNKNKIINTKHTIIKEVNKEITKEFIGDNHLERYIDSSINLGLYKDNILYSMMCFNIKDEHFTLTRMCNKIGYSLDNSKILDYFEIEYKPKTITIEVNRRFDNGDNLIKLGFSYIEDTKCNCFYFNPKEKILKNKYCKNDRKIFDSGHTIYKKYK